MNNIKNSPTNHDLQNFIGQGISKESNIFDFNKAKKYYLDKQEKYENERNDIEQKIQTLEKFPNKESFKDKSDELYTILSQIETKLQKNEKILGINPEIIKEYLERKQKQIISVSNNITNKLEQTNNLEYEEIEKIFSDDSEFLSTIQNEKENTFNDSLQSNTKLSLLKSLKSNINNLKTSLETTNSIDNKQINNSLEDITEEYRKDIEQELPSRLDYRYRVYHADFSRISPVKNSINDVYTGVKNIKKDKILLTELIANEKNINKKTYSQYKKIKKQLPFLLRYYGTALTASSKVNSLVDAASNYVGSMDKLKEFNYNLGDVIEDLELGNNLDLSKSEKLKEMSGANETTKSIEEQLQLAQEKIALNLKNFHGLKTFTDTYQKLPSNLSEPLQKHLSHFMIETEKLGVKILKKHPFIKENNTPMNSKYEYYNMIFSEYDEELKQSYEELSTCIKQLIKSPTIIDKIVILYMITEAYVELYTEVDQDNKTMSINELMEIINAILLYRTEEILADGTKEEYTKITSVSDFLSTFDNHYQNIITLKEKYPKLYKDIYDNSYYEELDIMNRREREMKNIAYIFENMDTIGKTKTSIHELISHISIKEENNENNVEQFKKIISENIHRLPYNDIIIVSSDTNKSPKNSEEYTLEIHRVNNPNYIGIIRFNSFDKAIGWEKFNQLVNDIKEKEEGNKMTMSQTKQMVSVKNQMIDDDIIAIHKIDSEFGGLIMLHTNWDISVNGINGEGLRYIVGDKEYDTFQTIVLKNLAEVCKIKDLRNENKNNKTPGSGLHEQEEIHKKDPRNVYDANSISHGGKKNLFYRKEHIRLLHEKMITGYTGRQKAKEVGIPLYACVYNTSSDPMIDDPIKTISLDTLGEDFSEVRLAMKKLREEYNTTTTIVRFQTYVDEFLKEGQKHQGQTITVLDIS